LENLVSAAWLAQHLDADDLAILDASRHLSSADRDPRSEFAAAHIPGARFLDLASLTDTASDVPAALPNGQQVARRLADIGIAPDMRIVVYDDSAVKTAARGWFALKANGVRNVAVLDGGLSKWRSDAYPLESGEAPATPAAPITPAAPNAAPAPIITSLPQVASKAEMLANITSRAAQVLDARGADRVFGSGIDPVHGGQNGRIPGALNLPFGEVFAADGCFKSPDELRAAFEGAGVDMTAPLVTTCGSGITASVLILALHLAGKDDVRLYDGSWQEWEADAETPKKQGPQ